MIAYYCWITALSEDCQSDVITGLVKKGYMVGAAAKDGKVVLDSVSNAPTRLIALSIYKLNDPESSSRKVYDDVESLLRESDFLFYSLIVSVSADSVWSGANVLLNPEEISPASNKDFN